MLPHFLLQALQSQVQDSAVFIHEPSQVRIVCKNEPSMFPVSWQTKEINATSIPLAQTEIQRSYQAVKAALDKYPRAALNRLKTVYVSKSITFYGLGYGGTNSTDAVYLSNKGAELGYTDKYLQSTVHHEYSSILLRNNPKFLDQSAWTATFPPDFQYRQGGTESVRSGTASTKYDPEFQEKGFLAQYATSSQEEDFNMIAEGLFSGEPSFWKAIDSYPRLNAKTNLVIAFYLQVNSAFTEPFFRSMVHPTSRQNQAQSP